MQGNANDPGGSNIDVLIPRHNPAAVFMERCDVEALAVPPPVWMEKLDQDGVK